jgi:hypothetical protein
MTYLALSLLMLAVSAEPTYVEATQLDGSKVVGQLIAWDGNVLRVENSEGSHSFNVLDLEQLESTTPPERLEAPPAVIELVDETRLPFSTFAVSNRTAVVLTPFSPKPATIRTDMIRRVEFRPSSDALMETWRRVEEREATGDALIIAKGTGEAFDYLTGEVGVITEEVVYFKWDGQEVPIKRSKVAGIEFYHGQPQKIRTPYCVVKTTDGRILPARGVLLANNMLTVETHSFRLDLELNVFASADFASGRMKYLSDLAPIESKWTPLVALPGAAPLASEFGAPRSNTSFSGSQLALAWPNESLATGREIRTFAKGLAMRSRSDVTYVLPAGMKHFVAVAGIDPATTDQGHVVLEIRADNRVVWEGEIDGKQPPATIDVELRSARRLHIHVDYGQNLDYGDRLHLVEPRVIK